MEIIRQLMLVVILWNPDDSFQTLTTSVSECPHQHTFGEIMESRRESGEIKSWVAFCTSVDFGVSEDVKA